MDEMKDSDTRLRLKRRTIWMAGEGEAGGDPHFCHRMQWAVDGVAGAVSLVVDMGGFRSGKDEQMAREVLADELPTREDRPAQFAFVECGLVVRSVWAHAARPWPEFVHAEYDREANCEVLGQPCFAKQLMYQRDPELHRLLFHLVQPGGQDYVWEFLEEKYRDTFDAKPSPEHELAQTRFVAWQLAQARAEGAARATGAAADAAQEMADHSPASTGGTIIRENRHTSDSPRHTSPLPRHEHTQ